MTTNKPPHPSTIEGARRIRAPHAKWGKPSLPSEALKGASVEGCVEHDEASDVSSESLEVVDDVSQSSSTALCDSSLYRSKLLAKVPSILRTCTLRVAASEVLLPSCRAGNCE